MKKLRDIPTAWKNGDDDPTGAPWDKDLLIDRLEADGHKTISVGRAVLTIEQAEPGDEVPKGWVDDALKVTVHPDPDAGFGADPCELHIHAHRAGLMEVFLLARGRTLRMVPLEAELVGRALSLTTLASVAAVAELARGTIGEFYGKSSTEVLGDAPLETIRIERDKKLGELARRVHEAMEAYTRHLRSLPGVAEEL